MWKTISSRDDVQEIVAQIRRHWPHTLITCHASKLSVWILCVRAMELVRCAYTGGECLLWVKTSHCLDQTNVRFAPESGHDGANLRCPLCATSGLMHCSNFSLFDHPVGSARPSIGSGMAKPSALPAFRSNVGRGFLSTRTSSLMRRNNCLRAVSCFNFSLFHFCHTLDDSSSSPQEQTEQIL